MIVFACLLSYVFDKVIFENPFFDEILPMEQLDEQPDSYHGDWTDHLFFLNSEDQLLDRSSSYCLALVVTDEYGREIVCPDIPVVYESDDWTWPDNSSMPSRDPGNWTY